MKQKFNKKFRENRKGMSAMVDVLLFSVISIFAITTLFIYAQSHQISQVSDVNQQAMNEYTSNTLLTLNYVTVGEDIKYSTVQKSAVTKTEYSKVLTAREWINYINDGVETVDVIERSIDQAGEVETPAEIVDVVNDIEKQINGLQEEVNAVHDSAKEMKNEIKQFGDSMKELCEGMESVSEKFGSVFGKNMNCNNIDTQTSEATKLLNEIITQTDKVNTELENVKEQLDSYKDSVQILPADQTPEINKKLHEIRCTLIVIKTSIDHYMNYLEVGVDLEASFIDLWPVEANLRGKTISEITGEALLVRNNFASTDAFGTSYARPLATGAGLFFFRNKSTGIGSMIDGKLEELPGTEISDCDESMCSDPIAPLNKLEFEADPAGISNTGSDCIKSEGGASINFNGNLFGVKIAVDDCASGKKGKLTLTQNNEVLDDYAFDKYKGNHENNINYGDYNVTVHISHRKDTSVCKCKVDCQGEDTKDCYKIIKIHSFHNKGVVDISQYQNYIKIASANNPDNYEITKFEAVILDGGETIEESTTDDFVKQIILGFIFMDRDDLRDNVKEMTKKRLDNLLTNQGYKYCYEAYDECEDCTNPVFSTFTGSEWLAGKNRIVITSDGSEPESCDYVKDRNITYGYANQPLAVPDNHHGEMRLYVWRKS